MKQKVEQESKKKYNNCGHSQVSARAGHTYPVGDSGEGDNAINVGERAGRWCWGENNDTPLLCLCFFLFVLMLPTVTRVGGEGEDNFNGPDSLPGRPPALPPMEGLPFCGVPPLGDSANMVVRGKSLWLPLFLLLLLPGLFGRGALEGWGCIRGGTKEDSTRTNKRFGVVPSTENPLAVDGRLVRGVVPVVVVLPVPVALVVPKGTAMVAVDGA